MKYYTTEILADKLGITYCTINNWIKHGKINVIEIEGHKRKRYGVSEKVINDMLEMKEKYGTPGRGRPKKVLNINK